MNFEEMKNDIMCDSVDEVVTGASLSKCLAYITMQGATFPDEYRVNYEVVVRSIEEMDCAENVRAVMRLRYRYGHSFKCIGKILGITYQWVYELHKTGVSLFEKHLSV